MGDVFVGATIFLSYAHADSEIANKVYNDLKSLGYDVKRDTQEVDKWDDLQNFMKSIREQDYAVFLVSDKYLHSVNCLYEIMQFMKDDNIDNRAFPIAIGFSEEEKNIRKTSDNALSMFDGFYWIEIVRYWQDYALKMKNQLDGIDHENAGELVMRYRVIKELAQTAAEFLGNSFAKKLLATIDPENLEIEDVVRCIDKKITSDMVNR